MNIQNRYNALYSEVVTQGDTIPCDILTISGKEVLTEGLSLRPFIKLKSSSPTFLDATALTSGSAIKISGTTTDTYAFSGQHAANYGAVLNGVDGAIYIKGNSRTGSVVGIEIGNNVAKVEGDDKQDCRDAFVDTAVVEAFGTGVQFNVKDTYLCGLRNVKVQRCGVAVSVPYDAGISNSGERMSMDNVTLSICDKGLFINSSVDFVVSNSSVDFCRHSGLHFGSNASYSKVTFTDAHFEECNDEGVIVSDTATYTKNSASIKGAKIVPTTIKTADLAEGQSLPTGGRVDGKACPRISLFKGKFELAIRDATIVYSKPSHNANSGLFLADDNVLILDASNIRFTNYKQAISKSLIVNYNWNFNEAMDGGDLEGWEFGASSNIAISSSDDEVFDGSDNSLKFECTGGDDGSNYAVMSTDLFDVEAGQRLINQHVVFGGASAGLVRVQAKIYQYHEDNNGGLTELKVNNSLGAMFKDLYNDTDDVAYNAGARDMWFKEKELHDALIVQGANKAKLEITVSALNVGDIVYLGAAFVNKV